VKRNEKGASMDQVNTSSEAVIPAVPVAAGPVAAMPMSAASLIAKLTLADKVIGSAAVVGVISTFLPAVSVTLELLGTKETRSVSVIADWRGKLGLLCFLAAGTILFLMIQKGAAASKNLMNGLLAACGIAALLGIFLLIGASSSLSDVPAAARQLMKANVAFGTYLFLLCGVGMGVGGFLKAKEQKLLGRGFPMESTMA
jgi:uncharacterized protein with PQ loop repeat